MRASRSGARTFARTVIEADAGGLELGSHVSQLCAVAVPTPIDRAIEGVPGVIGYHRYMDDGIIFVDSKETAHAAMVVVEEIAEMLHLVINPRKTVINRITHPFVFCKLRYTKQLDGSVRVNVRKQQSRRSVKHARNVARLSLHNPAVEVQPVRAALEGYLARGDAELGWLADRAFEI